MHLDRPIIVTGPPRSGTTLLAGLLNVHPHVGPKPASLTCWPTARAFIASLTSPTNRYCEHVERNWLWSTLLGGRGMFRELGTPLHDAPPFERETVPASWFAELTMGLAEGQRLLTKSPQHLLRLPTLRRLWPSLRCVVIVREGESVYASLAEHGSATFADSRITLANAAGVRLFARRWAATLSLIDGQAKDTMVVSYERLIKRPRIADDVRAFCGLTRYEAVGGPLCVASISLPWRMRVPAHLHSLLVDECRAGNAIIHKLIGGRP